MLQKRDAEFQKQLQHNNTSKDECILLLEKQLERRDRQIEKQLDAIQHITNSLSETLKQSVASNGSN